MRCEQHEYIVLRGVVVSVSSMGCPRLWHVLICTLISLITGAARAQRDCVNPFPLSEITLHLGSQFDKAFSLNKQYMQSIDPDRMLHTFRINAGLNSTAEPFSGSWEDPTCEVRGQFMGHYLSGGARLVNYTGDGSHPLSIRVPVLMAVTVHNVGNVRQRDASDQCYHR